MRLGDGAANLASLAKRVARRDLGEAAQVTDEVIDGYTVIAVGEHRVVLPEGARHFRAVLTCQRCQTVFVGRQREIRSRADLKAAARLCDRCSDTGWMEPEVDLRPWAWRDEPAGTDQPAGAPEGHDAGPGTPGPGTPTPTSPEEEAAPASEAAVHPSVEALSAAVRTVIEQGAAARQDAAEREARTMEALGTLYQALRDASAAADQRASRDRHELGEAVGGAMAQVTAAAERVARLEDALVRQESTLLAALDAVRADARRHPAPGGAPGEPGEPGEAVAPVDLDAIVAAIRDDLRDRLDAASEAAAADRRALAQRMDAVAAAVSTGGEATNREVLARLDGTAEALRRELRAAQTAAAEDMAQQRRAIAANVESAVSAARAAVDRAVRAEEAVVAERTLSPPPQAAEVAAEVGRRLDDSLDDHLDHHLDQRLDRLAADLRDGLRDRLDLAAEAGVAHHRALDQRVEAVAAELAAALQQVAAQLPAKLEAALEVTRAELRHAQEAATKRVLADRKDVAERLEALSARLEAIEGAVTTSADGIGSELSALADRTGSDHEELRTEMLGIMERANVWMVRTRDELLGRIDRFTAATAGRLLPGDGTDADLEEPSSQLRGLQADIEELQGEMAAMSNALRQVDRPPRAPRTPHSPRRR